MYLASSDHHTNILSIRTLQMSTHKPAKKSSTPQRPTVTFTLHTKDSPGHALNKSRPLSDKVKVPSLIPRLRTNREREEYITGNESTNQSLICEARLTCDPASRTDTTNPRISSRCRRKRQLLETSSRPPQSALLQLDKYESDDDSSEHQMDADQKIVAVSALSFSEKKYIWEVDVLQVLNKIQEVWPRFLSHSKPS